MGKAGTSPDDLLSTPEAGVELGVTPARVQVLIYQARLPAIKVGKMWVIRRGDLDLVRDRPPGRPRGPRKKTPHDPASDAKPAPKKATTKKPKRS